MSENPRFSNTSYFHNQAPSFHEQNLCIPTELLFDCTRGYLNKCQTHKHDTQAYAHTNTYCIVLLKIILTMI